MNTCCDITTGDFHPANVLWRSDPSISSTDGVPFLVDFEMVGLGSGPQDIAQYLISHMLPELRRECENRLVLDYYSHLTDGTLLHPCDYSLEQCWEDYKHGGAERWVWLLLLLATMCPDSMVQYFHDQLRDFIVDHHIDENNVGMPRV